MPDYKKLFLLADEALTRVVDQIPQDAWEKVPGFYTRGTPDKPQTLRDIINYHAYDEAWVPETLAGMTAEEVGSKYDGDLLGEDLKKSWHDIVGRAKAAVEALSDEDLKKTVHLSYGEYPAHDYLWHITTFRMYRTVDIARFLGVDDSLPEKLVSGMWDILAANEQMLRQYQVIQPALPITDDAPLYEKLLAFSGRQPRRV